MGAALRIGVLGAANIARQFAAAVAGSQRVRIDAVASRTLATAEGFARDCGIPRAFGSYEALLADPQIDAVYVPLPNTLHADWAIRALDAGKHVLCEKPLATTSADARAMFAAARRNGRHLVEAYPYRAQPQTLKLRELIAESAIGRVRIVTASFGVMFSDPADIRLRPEVGGGALLDAGSYAFSLIRMVAGERPVRVSAVANWAETGVDRSLVATIEFPSGILAVVTCTFATAYHRLALVAGEAGTIETTYLNHPPFAGPPVLTLRRGIEPTIPRETIEVPGGSGFLAEAESFADMIAEGPERWSGATPEESIDIALSLEALAQSARSGAPVTLPTERSPS